MPNDLQTTLNGDWEYASTFHEQGIKLQQQQQYNKAEEMFDKAILAYLHNLAYCKEQYEVHEKAPSRYQVLKKLNDAINKNLDSCAASHYRQGLMSAQQNQYEKAISSYEQAIEKDPTALYYISLATCLEQTNQHEKAIPNYEKAIEIEPKAYYYGRLASCLEKTNQHEKAIDALEEINKIDPQPDRDTKIAALATLKQVEGSNKLVPKEAVQIAGNLLHAVPAEAKATPSRQNTKPSNSRGSSPTR